MKTSSDRILTTHTGSLPRSPELLELLYAKERGEGVDPDDFRKRVATDLDEVLGNQLKAGIDVGSDGELPRIGFSTYVKNRCSGFGGEGKRAMSSDFNKFPKYVEHQAGKMGGGAGAQMLKSATNFPVPEARGKIEYDPELSAVREELELFTEALGRQSESFVETFVTAASPGILAITFPLAEGNSAYANLQEYTEGLAAEMQREYEFIVKQGHVLQIDAPDLGAGAQFFLRRSVEEMHAALRGSISALNKALTNIPKDCVRMHVCWGNRNGPHIDDVPLETVIPIVYEANVGAISFSAANPRHQHEYKVFSRVPPPDDLVLIPGVIDVTTNYLEHPEGVADRICLYAEAIGDPKRVMAGTDCGFGTMAGVEIVAEDVAWKKLEMLSEGAAIATKRLFG